MTVEMDMMLFVGRIDVFRQQGIDVVLDKVQEAGIESLLLGDLVIDGSPAFEADPAYYADAGMAPPEVAEDARDKVDAFRRAVEVAKGRGLRLYLHDWGQGAARASISYPQSLAYGLARTRDVKRALPEIDGYVLDGPEFGYEIQPGHRSDLLAPLDETSEADAAQRGYDVEAMRRDRRWLIDALHHIDIPSARRWLEGELAVTDVVDLLMMHPGLLDALRFRAERILDLLGAYRDGIKALDPALAIACGPRISAFAPLTGYNYGALAEVVDFFCPKLYLWHEGIDGLKGTVGRYADTLVAWNPTLPESLAIDLVCKAFGLPLPGMHTLNDLHQPLSPAFFERTLRSEIDKAVLRTGDPAKLRLFLGLHHGGVHMSTEEMRRILMVIEDSPCDHVVYWEYGDITDEQWAVLKHYRRGRA
jgi:hypothetical protein